MNLKTKNEILTPQYMKKFKCIGSLCEDSCCSGWKVTIDEKTYRKYRKSQHIELKPKFKKYIKRERSHSTESNFAKIKMNENNACSFLDEKSLCSIQTTLGEEYLSNTCSTYPRIVNSVNGVIEKAATISCPEAARLILLNPIPMQFDHFLDEDLSANINKAVQTKTNKDTLQYYFWNIRIFSIGLIQNRNYNIESRLILLGLFFQKLQNKIDMGLCNEVPNLITNFSNMINQGNFDEALEKIPEKPKVNLMLFKEIIKNKFSKGISNKRYFECLNEMIQGLKESSNNDSIDNIEHYKKILREHYKPFIKNNEYMLENYLVNYIFKNLYPLEYNQPFDDYMMLVIHYSLIKNHLIGMSAYHKGLTPDLVVKLIQSFAKSIEHDPIYLYRVLKFVKDNECNNMAYMSVFIKS